jgi:hypothetical protein
MLSLSDGNCSFIGLGETGLVLYGDQEVGGKKRREGSRNASELNPTFGLDCVEERREVSYLRSEDWKWFRPGEQKFSAF